MLTGRRASQAMQPGPHPPSEARHSSAGRLSAAPVIGGWHQLFPTRRKPVLRCWGGLPLTHTIPPPSNNTLAKGGKRVESTPTLISVDISCSIDGVGGRPLRVLRLLGRPVNVCRSIRLRCPPLVPPPCCRSVPAALGGDGRVAPRTSRQFITRP